jgi:hypothetical protein
MSKIDVDWEGIEREYRAGQLSLREIGREYGVSEAAIRKRAKKEAWSRDLTAKVQAAVRTELVRAEVRSAHRDQTEREIVAEAAMRGVDVILAHRTDVKAARTIVSELLTELAEASTGRAEIEAAIEDETAKDQGGGRRAAMLKAVSLSTRSTVLVNLSAALKNVISLERQAFNLDAEAQEDPSNVRKMSREARQAEIAALLAKAKPSSGDN